MHIHGVRRRLFGAAMSIAAAVALIAVQAAAPVDAGIPRGSFHQTNLIMPEPTVFLDRKFPVVSIIRPTETTGAAHGAVKFLTDMGLFLGQSSAFFATLNDLATQADAARRGM